MTRALWITGKERCALQPAKDGPASGGVTVDTLFTGISRGTEALVFAGAVPASEHGRMRAPFQEGDFTFPVKYGYSAVGRVADGDRKGEIVFALHPHQDRFRVPVAALTTLPDALPPERAVLGANMETALNIVWDSGAGPGDRVCVVGAGVVGALAAWLCGRIPGTEVTLIDTNPARAVLADRLGVRFCSPQDAPMDCDVAIHASANAAGLQTAIDAAGSQARIVEASWYGERPVEIALGGGFHSRRLQLVSSQVGSIPPSRAPRWDFSRRLAAALDLLASDDALDTLVTGTTPFDTLDRDYAAILADPGTLCHRITYQTES